MLNNNDIQNNIIIHTLVKDESHILNEWIVHNILIGIKHIYIFDDQSSIPVSQTIEELPNWIKEKITIVLIENNIDFYDINSFKNSSLYNEELYEKYSKIKQLYFQNYFLQNFKNSAEWCLLCDVDEFIYLNDNITLDTIINDYNIYDIIYVPWLIYGSSFHVEQPDGLIINNFTMHDINYFFQGKSFFKLSNVNEILCPFRINNYNMFCFDHNQPIYTLPIHINHYQINSVKLYIQRKLRKEIGTEFGISKKSEEIFTFIKRFNDILSVKMNKYIDNINNILNRTVINQEVSNYKDLYPYFFIVNDEFIYNSLDYNNLLKILNSTNVRYFSLKYDLPDGFNKRIYRIFNKDLAGMYDVDIYKHYIIHGRLENRVYSYAFPENFSIDAYKNLNIDLEHLNIDELYNHFINLGFKENRLYKYDLPDNFNVNYYRILNYDLSNLTDIELYKHYTICGKYENRKYNYSSNNLIIHTIIKDEDHILNEWIVHHILIGIKHIYIYDDQSSIPIVQTIETLPSWIKNKVTVFKFEDNIDFYDINSFKYSTLYDEVLYSKYCKLKQLYFQNYFLKKYKNIADWCLFSDVDEFIYLNNNTINNILEQYCSYDIIFIPWLIYGSSFHIDQPNGLVIDDFRMHDTNYFHLGKSICNINKITEIICIHKVNNLNKIFYFDHNQPLYTLPIHINHYQINSVKLYIKRKLRNEIGWENGLSRTPEEIFTFIKYFNNIYSNIMDKYINGINNVLNRTLSTNKEIDTNLYPYFFINNDEFIYNCTTTTNLYSILNSNNIRYFSIKNDLPEGFNITIYKKLNKDLVNLSDENIYKHYMIHGKIENRQYLYNFPNGFNITAYKNLNVDLSHFNEDELYDHYITIGYKENRLYKYYIPENFDINLYRDINNDLNGLSNDELYKHFTIWGQYENRIYNIDDLNKKNAEQQNAEQQNAELQNTEQQNSEQQNAEQQNNNNIILQNSSQIINSKLPANRGINNAYHIDNIINNIIATRHNIISNLINKNNGR